MADGELEVEDERFFDESVSMIQQSNLPQSNVGVQSKMDGAKGQKVSAPQNSGNNANSKCISDRQNGNSMPRTSNVVNRQQNDVARMRDGNKNKNDGRRDHNQQHNQRPQYFQNRDMAPNHDRRYHHQNQFGQPPPHQFNSYQNQNHPPMHLNQPTSRLGQQMDRRNMRPNYQNQRIRYGPSHDQFGDPEFEACFGHPPHHIQIANGPMNIPPFHHPMHSFPRPVAPQGLIVDPNFDNRNAPKTGRNRKYNRTKGNRPSITNGGAKADVQSSSASNSTNQTTSRGIENQLQQVKI